VKKNDNFSSSDEIRNSVYFNKKSADLSKKRVVEKGDVVAYKRLTLYCTRDRYLEILPYAIVISEKYDNGMASYDVYELIVRSCNEENYKGKYSDALFANLNEAQRQFALYYLNKSAKQRNIGGVTVLERLYRNGIGLKKNIEKADSILKVGIPVQIYY
jgi:hypothetical protein